MKRTAFLPPFVISILFLTAVMVWPMAHPWPQFRANSRNSGKVDNRGPRTASLMWTYNLWEDVRSSPAVANNGQVIVGTDDGFVQAINSDGTSMDWAYETGGPVDSSPALHPLFGWIYVGSDDNNLYALNADGSLYWSHDLLGNVDSSPTLSSDASRIYVGNNLGQVSAIDISGSLIWSYPTGAYVDSSPAEDSNGTVYVTSWDNNIYAINSDGILFWTYRTGHYVTASPAIGVNGIYVGSCDNNVYAINASGSLSWTYRTGGNFTSSPALTLGFLPVSHLPYDKIHVASNDGRLYQLIFGFSWSYETGANMDSSPAIGSDGLIYVADYTGRLHAVKPDGSCAWTYDAIDFATSPAIGYDGRLYVGSLNNYLYCFQDPDRLALLVSQGVGDLNLYFWNAPFIGDWTQWDALARNPSPLARDFWQIPIGNDGIGITSIDIGSDDLALLVRQASNDLNIYFWNSPVPDDWTQWDALARNPSPLARDFWQIPVGNDGIGIALIREHLALLVKQASNDLNLYFWNAPVAGDWTRWDALARNPSPLARDFWQIPIGNDGIGITAIDVSDPPAEPGEIAILVREGPSDLNVYFWQAPWPGDWTYWDALARNPSPIARDFWQIPIGNDGIGLTSIDIDKDGRRELGLLVRQGANDLNIYFWNAPVPGDWTQWDALARNPSPLARDFWQIPIGNDGIGLTGIAMR